MKKNGNRISEKESSLLVRPQFNLSKIVLLLFLTISVIGCSNDDEPKIPFVIDAVFTQTDFDLNDNTIAQKGNIISIEVQNVIDKTLRYEFSLGGVACKLISIIGNKTFRLEVPENAKPGNLVMTDGNQQISWPTPIRLLDPPVINAFIESDNTLIKKNRNIIANYKEVGTVFTPLKNGTIVALGLRISNSKSTPIRVTLWDANPNAESDLVSLRFAGKINTTLIKKLETPITVKMGEQYAISVFNNNWYNYMHDPTENIYPSTVNENIKLEKTVATNKYLELSDDYDFPDEDIQTYYISLGAEFVFVPDID